MLASHLWHSRVWRASARRSDISLVAMLSGYSALSPPVGCTSDYTLAARPEPEAGGLDLVMDSPGGVSVAADDDHRHNYLLYA